MGPIWHSKGFPIPDFFISSLVAPKSRPDKYCKIDDHANTMASFTFLLFGFIQNSDLRLFEVHLVVAGPLSQFEMILSARICICRFMGFYIMSFYLNKQFKMDDPIWRLENFALFKFLHCWYLKIVCWNRTKETI